MPVVYRGDADAQRRAHRLAEWLVEWLDRKGWNARTLHYESGISESQISTIKNFCRRRDGKGVILPRRSTIIALAKAFGADIDEPLQIIGYTTGTDTQTQDQVDSADIEGESDETLENEILDITYELILSVYRRDLDFYREHATEDMSAYEWFIAPARIDGLDFHLHLLGAGGMVGVHEESRIDLLAPRVQICGAAGDVAVVTFTLLVTFPAEGSGKPTFYTDNQTRVLVREGDGVWKMNHFHRSTTHT